MEQAGYERKNAFWPECPVLPAINQAPKSFPQARTKYPKTPVLRHLRTEGRGLVFSGGVLRECCRHCRDRQLRLVLEFQLAPSP
jgi:hypothetical protein